MLHQKIPDCMPKKILIRIDRDFGDLIGDGMKVVFRNIKPILHAVMWYAFPFIAISMIILIVTGSYKMLIMPDDEMVTDLFAFFSSFSVIGIGLAAGFVMINLIVYGALIDYDKNEGEVTFEGIRSYIYLNWKNYLVSILVEAIIFGAIVALMIGSIAISPLLFGVTYLLGIILLMYIYNILQFLGIVRIEEDLNISDGINRCFYLLKNNWWSTFGVILVSSFIGSILMYAFILPISIVLGFLSAMEVTGTGEDYSLWINILSGAFVILYALIGILSNMYLSGVRGLKYFDLVEKKEARNLIKEIELIGDSGQSSIFENEGNF